MWWQYAKFNNYFFSYIPPFITGQTNKPTNRQTDLRGHREVTLLIFDFRYYNSEKAFPDKWNSCELSPRNDKGENRPKSQTSQTLL